MNWISVTERLPPDNTQVLAWSWYHSLALYRSEDATHEDRFRGWTTANVTHWMPLPDPPETAE